ncbi:uncharacterized protein LOC143298884 [Babylonia areolata]|uniref:uncharacterized protein LOC143298884 n=1 Tax=Babylonia areolata TaxID=304850 RepID=UPI003FCEF4F1
METFDKVSRFLLLGLQEISCKLKATAISKVQTLSFGSKVVVNLVVVLVYGYLLATSYQWSGDHVEIGCVFILTFLPTIRFLGSLYAKLFLAFLFRLLSAYGWVRIFVYSVFVLTFAYWFVAIFLDNSALKCKSIAKDLFLSRFENNTLNIKERRLYFEREILHPLYDEGHFPQTNHQLIRFPMEDAEMNCTTYIFGFPGGKPFNDQVQWRRNGVPLLTMSDRYSVVTKFRELPRDSLTMNENMKALGLTVYQLNSTLSIYLLHDEDFGSYTCHHIDKVSIPMNEWRSKTGKEHFPKFNDYKNDNTKNTKGARQGCQCSSLPERKYVFQDVYTHTGEFRLIKMEETHDQIEAPVASILFFETNYLHLSSDEDVQSDYTVNDASFQGLCTDTPRFSVSGCSSLQRLLAFFMNDGEVWWFLDILPFSSTHGHTNGAHRTSGHCLCENSFGRHSMKYTRRYYNRTSGRYDMFEVVHPNTLLVRPPRQASSNLDFFANIWSQGSARLLPLVDYLPEWAYELTLLKDLAVVSGIILHATDGVFICLVFILFCFVFKWNLYLLKVVGHLSRKCFLEGSMGYLYTARLTFRSLLHDPTNKTAKTGGNSFDIFLSHSDTRTDTVIVESVLCLLESQLDLKVCLRERDLPPNGLELKDLASAIESSQRFIIFLSKDFLQDPFHEMEASTILETLWDRQSMLDVLLIKADDSQVPVLWRNLTVHDWTSGNLSLKDHHLRLVQWLTSRVQPVNRALSVLDVLTAALPLVPLLCLVFFIPAWAP